MAHVVAFYDLRPVDFMSGKRAPFDPDSMFARTCDRCGTRHARVFEVATDDGRVVSVGEGCMAVAFTGLSEAEILAARKADTMRHKIALARTRADVAGIVEKSIAFTPYIPRVDAFRKADGTCQIEVGRTCPYSKVAPRKLDPARFEAIAAVTPGSNWGHVEITADNAPDLYDAALRRAAYVRICVIHVGKAQKDEVTRQAATDLLFAELRTGAGPFDTRAREVIARTRKAGR